MIQDARPQSLMLNFLGIHLLGRPIAVYSGSVIEVFARIEVSEQAVRSTLARMVDRGLLARHRHGRKMYFALTARARTVLADGHRRIWRVGAVNRDWDGTWTMVGFSLPESWSSQRHELRSRLSWGGFGLLQNGVWIAPGPVDVPALLTGIDLDEHLRVFTATTAAPSEDEQIIRTAFDTEAVAAGYQEFLRRWENPPALADPLARQLLLHTDWLQVIRNDPHLPARHLPEDWPAIRAENLFHSLATAYAEPARSAAESALDTVHVTD